MTGGDQFVRGGPNRSLIDIRERDGSARLCEGLGRCQAHTRSGASNECDFALKRQVHNEFLLHHQANHLRYCSSLTFSIQSTVLPFSDS